MNELPKYWDKMTMLATFDHWAWTLLWYPHFSGNIFLVEGFHWRFNCLSYSHALCSSWKENWKPIRWSSVAYWYFQNLVLHNGSVARNSNIFYSVRVKYQETFIISMHHSSIVTRKQHLFLGRVEIRLKIF